MNANIRLGDKYTDQIFTLYTICQIFLHHYLKISSRYILLTSMFYSLYHSYIQAGMLIEYKVT